MGPFEQIAADFHTQATRDWDEAVTRFAVAADAGECLTAEEFSRLAVAQHAHDWWQRVMDRINAADDVETTDAASVIMDIRHAAEKHLISESQVWYGELFTQAMAQARRQAARQFLEATRHLAEALSGPTPANGATVVTSPAAGSASAGGGGHQA
ncbi:hypothetical protein ACFY05_39815 [Microtetraspora fusca]|uniref:Phasin protein n=1 Tax=Microtetraspora fusca TaxID=1997 RepID=A0ABW6VMJ0_MICFU